MDQAVEEITAVLMRCARGTDRRDWDLVRSCYHPDAYDDHGAYKGGVDGLLADMAERHATVRVSLHHLTNVLVEVEGDVAFAEAYCLAYQRFTDDEGGDHDLHVQCRYVDRFERRDGEWRIARRTVVFETQTVTEPLVGLPADPRFTVGKRSTEDPVYQLRAQ